MRKSIFTRFFAAKYAMAGLLLFGGIAASFAMKAAISAAVAEELVATAITPDPAASVEKHLQSLKTIDVTFDAPISKVTSYVTFKKLGDYENYENVTLTYKENVLTITLHNEVSEYGIFVLSIPQGTVATADGKVNESIDVMYHIGSFEPTAVYPTQDKTLESLKEVTVFMSGRVGGVLEGAKLNVYKDGDKEVAYTTATIDYLNTNANEATITLAEEVTEYGKYTIEVPAGVIFDKYYNGEDPMMTGAQGNDAFELTYQVGTFEPVSVLPAMDERVESLKEVTVFMTDRVGGVLDGAKLNVYKDGDKEAAYRTATIDILNTNASEATITLDEAITEYGRYTIEVPANVIFDKYFSGEDPLMSGAQGNEPFELIYNVGFFEPVSVLPAMDERVEALKEVTVFMTDRVGGVLDGAKLNVYKDGDTEAPFTTATIDFLTSVDNEATITLAEPATEYGRYTIEVPAGVIFDKFYNGEDAAMTGAASNEAFELTYNVGTFEPVSVLPAEETPVSSLKEVTVFMTDRVGGVLDGAKLNVYKDGDKEVPFTTATIDFLTPVDNEAIITLADEATEYGKYTIEVPAGVIFDKFYTGEDAAMTGVGSNEAFELTYQVGTFEPVSVIPAMDERVESLKEVTVFMSDRVGGVLDGAKLNVYKDGDKEVAYRTATIDILNTNANEATITLDEAITEYGTYTIEVPAGVIFDKFYNGEDGMMSGATGNEAFELTYKVGFFESVSVLPSNENPVSFLKEVTVFMTDRVGGVLDGAKINVYKDGDTEVAYRTATIDILNTNSNEVTITLDDEITEYGKYQIVIPAGVIFDKYYTGEDSFMSGATGNEEIVLEYQVGFFDFVSAIPATDKPVKSLNEVTVFMTDRVGGVLDGAKINVYKDGDKSAVYRTATLEILNTNANEVTLTLNKEITANGKYTFEIPAGVIFDKYFDEIDPFMSGAQSNPAIELTYIVDTTVGISGVTTEGADEAIYNIGGVRMQKAGNGLYIINGKKVVIRKK